MNTNWLSILFVLGLAYLVIRSGDPSSLALDPEKIVKRSDHLAHEQNFLVDTDE